MIDPQAIAVQGVGSGYFATAVQGFITDVFTGWTETATGGISFSGLAMMNSIFSESALGGITLSGGVLRSDTYAELSDGGVMLSGAAIVQWIPAGAAGFARRLWYRLGLGF